MRGKESLAMQTIKLKRFSYTSISFLFSALVCLGCNGAAFREACIKLEAKPDLNLFNGQPHPVTLFLYPLNQRLGFEQMGVNDLLEGKDPPGKVGERVSTVVNPGEQRAIEERFSGTAVFIGIVVDYYREPGSQEGSRRVVLEAKCSWRQPTVVLGPRNAFVD
jgi:type VI secretion system VasD/TssJ family lipoprotein